VSPDGVVVLEDTVLSPGHLLLLLPLHDLPPARHLPGPEVHVALAGPETRQDGQDRIVPEDCRHVSKESDWFVTMERKLIKVVTCMT
jgi:hypothetical protein